MATPEAQFGDTPVICETLRDLHDSGQLPIRKVADILNLAQSTGYELFNRDIKYSQFRTLFRHCGDSDVQLKLLANLLNGTPWVATHVPPDMDPDGSGDCNFERILDAVCDITSETADYYKHLRDAVRDQKVDDQELRDCNENSLELMQLIVGVQMLVSHIHEQGARRRQARTPKTFVGGGA